MGEKMADEPQRLNLFFRLVVVAGALFAMTILALVATIFGDDKAPLARLLNQYVGMLLAAEAVATVLLGIAGLVVDQRNAAIAQPAQEPTARRAGGVSPLITSSGGKPTSPAGDQPNAG
jgi:hypothetical protein